MVSGDPFDLDRFVRAQQIDYDQALSEIREGRKRTHWMWYIFPQLEGLGSSCNSVHYSISGIAEAEAYLAHPVLGPRLVTCAEATLRHEGLTAFAIFGYPDDMKFRSSATLFASVSPAGSVFHRIIDRFFQGQPDERTLRLLQLLQRK
ncbi:MAG: DUF1810 domain-containing protein [Acidobacteria bacterium]|nr:DUF1810 domain-containing protein [Acidobacteriota bacterium]